MSEINKNEMETEEIKIDEAADEKAEIVPLKEKKLGEILDAVKEPALVVLGTAASIAVLCVSSKLGGKAVKGILKALKKK